MQAEKFVVALNFNRIELDSWIDKTRQPDGSYRLVGMGRRTEFDADTGAIVSEKIEPTGLTGTAPHDAFGERRTFRQWLHSVMYNCIVTGAEPAGGASGGRSSSTPGR